MKTQSSLYLNTLSFILLTLFNFNLVSSTIYPASSKESQTIKPSATTHPLSRYLTTLSAISEDIDQVNEEYDTIQSLLEKEPYVQTTRTMALVYEEHREKTRPCGACPYMNNIVTTEGKIYNTAPVDYINGSRVSVSISSLEFLAVQAPLKETVDDLFNVMIENNSDTIVSMVMPKEPKRNSENEIIWKDRCDEYWAHETDLKHGYRLQTGTIISTMSFDDTEEAIVIRELLITKDGKPFRTIKQHHYQNWPDHGTPNPKVYEVFMQTTGYEVINHSITMVGHCHAGSGRTGIFLQPSLQQITFRSNLP